MPDLERSPNDYIRPSASQQSAVSLGHPVHHFVLNLQAELFPLQFFGPNCVGLAKIKGLGIADKLTG